jgi:hypothetical protein
MNRESLPGLWQASLSWLRPRSAIPQTYEAWRISPKRARCAKDEIRRSALHCQGLFAYRGTIGSNQYV